MNHFRKSVRQIIERTLEHVTSYPATGRTAIDMIDLTFLCQSGYAHTCRFEQKPYWYGFAAMTKDEIEEIIIRYIKPRKNMVKDINSICLVDLSRENLDDVVEAMSYNIALQSLVVYFYYCAITDALPNNLESAATVYSGEWVGAKRTTREALQLFIGE